MPLRPAEAPEAVRAAAAKHVYQLASPRGAFAVLRDVPREQLALVAPHRMYTLRLDSIERGSLDAAQPSGWRFLITDNSRVLASAETPDDTGDLPYVNAGPYVGSTARAIDELERLPEVSGSNYELRILKVPALYVVAAWLVGGPPIVVPLAPTPSFLEAGSRYSEA